MAYIQQKEDVLLVKTDDFSVYCGKGSGITTFSEIGAENPVMLYRDEAIAAARAILKHFGECE